LLKVALNNITLTQFVIVTIKLSNHWINNLLRVNHYKNVKALQSNQHFFHLINV
jgi:hypothetical protein